MDPVQIARKVLELAEEDDYEGILNLAATSKETMVNKESPFNIMRKYYLKLSLTIHPDRLGKTFKDAARAFQALVKAFESLSTPEMAQTAADASSSRRGGSTGSKQPEPLTILRSNENCYRTRVLCPRCSQPWNENTLDGNPDYFYNLLMMGLKRFYCSTCLCEFGCMSAVHLCPFCSRRFDYHPSLYHRQVSCGHVDKGCGSHRLFGFRLYSLSDRRMKELKTELQVELAQKLKEKEAKARRLARAKRGQDASGGLSQAELEKSFLFGLRDVCPRCGEDFTETENQGKRGTKEGEAAVLHHLLNCTNEKKHAVYQQQQSLRTKRSEAKAQQAARQEQVETAAIWQMLGSNNEQLYLLDEEQLLQEAKRRGVKLDDEGKGDVLMIEDDGDGSKQKKRKRKTTEAAKRYDKDTLIEKIVSHDRGEDDDEEEKEEEDDDQPRRKKHLITAASSSSSSSSSTALVVAANSSKSLIKASAKKKKKVIDANSIPSNYHSLGVEQLKSILIAQGLKKKLPTTTGGKKAAVSKADLLELIEEYMYED